MRPLMPTRATPVPPCTFSLPSSSLVATGEKNNAQRKETNLLTLVLSHYRGMAPVAHVLFNKFMKFNPKNPKWLNRDRFVLS